MKTEDFATRATDVQSGGNDSLLEWSPPPEWLSLSRALDAIRRKNAETTFGDAGDASAAAMKPPSRTGFE
jgi:hypothetical protein